MIRIKTLFLAGVMGMVLAGTANAQFFAQMGPLEGMSKGNRLLGAYLGMGSGSTNLSAELRMGSGPHSSLGIAATLDHSVFGAQLDLRGGLRHSGGQTPLELGGQLAGGFMTGNGATGIYAQAVPGLSFRWGSMKYLSSWAGLGYRLSANTSDVGDGSGIIRLGSRLNVSPTMALGVSLEDVGGNSKIMLGGDYTF